MRLTAPVVNCSKEHDAQPFAVKLDEKVKVVAPVDVGVVGDAAADQPAATSATSAGNR